jgi:phospholipid/cholesterol/gamma-HCH transport system permease protein
MRPIHPVDVPGVWKLYAVRMARRWPGLIGARLIASSVAVAVLVQACRPLTWRRTVRAELVRNCVQVALYGLPSIIITGLLVGLAMVHQVLYWLRLAGQEELIGELLALGLGRELAPILVGMIVIGRSGSVMMVELEAMRANGQVHLLEAQGIDPLLYLVIPRVLATALGMFCLNMVFLAVLPSCCRRTGRLPQPGI